MLAVAFLSFLSQALRTHRAPWHWPAPLHHAHHSPEWWVVWAVLAVQGCALGLGHRRMSHTLAALSPGLWPEKDSPCR